VGSAGLALLVATGLYLPADAPFALMAYLGLVSLVVKRLGFHVSPDVTHSLGSTVDVAALLILGSPLAGWPAALSTLAATTWSAATDGEYRRTHPEGLLFNAGLKALLVLFAGVVSPVLDFPGSAGYLTPLILLKSTAIFVGWTLLDHLGWGLMIALRGGRLALTTWLRKVIPASILVELAPMPVSLFTALVYVTLGAPSLALATAILVALAAVIGKLAQTTFVLRQRVEELAALNRMGGEMLRASLDEDSLCELIYQQASRIVDASNFQLGLFEGDDYAMRVWIRHGVRQTPAAFARAAGEGIIGWVGRTGQPLLVRDFVAESAALPAAPNYASPDPPRSAIFVPLLAGDRPIGVMAIQSYQRAAFTQNHLRLLTTMANQAAGAISNARLQTEAAEKRRLEQELEVARQIQASLLPECCPNVPGYDLAAEWRSALQVGGDLYDFFHLSDGRWGLLVGDVSGKGVSAALFMALARSLIRSAVIGAESPAAGLRRASKWILDDTTSGLFITVFYGVLDPAVHRIVYVNCGHLPALIARADGSGPEWLRAPGTALGIVEEVALEEHSASLAPGDTLLIYTDGVTEAQDAAGAFFGAGRLADSARQAPAMENAGGVVDSLLRDLADFVGSAPQSDDITIVALRRNGEGHPPESACGCET
jgi:serine phosphatase RsbU (regulator of sigma subunit)